MLIINQIEEEEEEEDNLVNETAVNPFKEEGGENKKKSEHS